MSALVTIITPAYNAAPYIAETIRSVLAQTYTNWEYLVVNDGSKDDTAAVIAPFLSDPRIRLITQDNAGVSVARNNGLAQAKGEYIALLDADDWWVPENLAKKIAVLESDPSCAWVFSNMQRYYQQSGELKASEPGKGENIAENLLLWNGEVVPGLASNLVMRSSCVNAGMTFDPQFTTAADQDFAFRLASGFKGQLLPEALFVYRMLPGSMSRNLQTLERDHIGVYRKAKRLGLFHSFTFRQRCFGNLYLVLAGNWWVNGKNKTRGMQFILRALLAYPPVLSKLVRKVAQKENE